jgi:hypothetical protein
MPRKMIVGVIGATTHRSKEEVPKEILDLAPGKLPIECIGQERVRLAPVPVPVIRRDDAMRRYCSRRNTCTGGTLPPMGFRGLESLRMS